MLGFHTHAHKTHARRTKTNILKTNKIIHQERLRRDTNLVVCKVVVVLVRSLCAHTFCTTASRQPAAMPYGGKARHGRYDAITAQGSGKYDWRCLLILVLIVILVLLASCSVGKPHVLGGLHRRAVLGDYGKACRHFCVNLITSHGCGSNLLAP